MATPNKVFFCAARRGPTVASYGPAYGNQIIALMDYAANNANGNGVVRNSACIQLSDITDGTSSTMLVGDKTIDPSRIAGGNGTQAPGTVGNDNNGYWSGWNPDSISYIDTSHPPRMDKWGVDGTWYFGSMHSSRFQAVFADNSVHSISYSIDPTVWSYLGNIADGQRIPASDDW